MQTTYRWITPLLSLLVLAAPGCADEPEAEVLSPRTAPGCVNGGCTTMQPFMMFSSYRLAPYSERYVRSAMFALGQRDVAGVVYATLGFTEQLWQDGLSGGLEDEAAYNVSLFEAATEADADLWLQLRVYDNVLEVGSQTRNFTADEILEDQDVQAAFLDKVHEVVVPYADRFPGRCTIVAFEENSIYHHYIGSGGFWAGAQWPSPDQGYITPSSQFDALYVQRVTDVFQLIRDEVASIDDTCDVGIHVGHAPVYRQMNGRSLLGNVIGGLGEDQPDFIFYDLYAKAQVDFATFDDRLRNRFVQIRNETDRPIYYLGQLHTMNAFQHGDRRGPSKRDIDESVEIAMEEGAAAVGFYTKNTRSTKICTQADVDSGECHSEDLAPLFPNDLTFVKLAQNLWEPQKTVFESSKDRWDYGVGRLMAARGDDRSEYFDVVLDGTGLGPANYELWIWNYDEGSWDLAGLVDPVDRGLLYDYDAHAGAVAIRGIERGSHCRPGGVHLRLDRVNPGADGTLQAAYVMPFGGAHTFYSENGLNARIDDNVLAGLALDVETVDAPIEQRRFVHLDQGCL